MKEENKEKEQEKAKEKESEKEREKKKEESNKELQPYDEWMMREDEQQDLHGNEAFEEEDEDGQDEWMRGVPYWTPPSSSRSRPPAREDVRTLG